MLAKFQYIEKTSELEDFAKSLLSEKIVAFDTEADSFYHYFDKTCLVQAATRRRVFLIDPIALGGPAKLAPLGPIMASPAIRKIFHAAEYDLFVLKRDCGFTFRNLFDTMISAQLLGYSALGLGALVERHFEVSLPKDEQRSDWSARPLRSNQLEYAAADVSYLIRLAEKLERELRKANREHWAEEEFELLRQREWGDRSFDEFGYLRIKGARRMDPEALSVLRELFLWRDARAREMDRPPFKILGNRSLVEIAQLAPSSQQELTEIKGVTELILRRYGRDVLAAVAKGHKKPHGPLPKPEGGGRRRMDRHTERRLLQLKRWRQDRAKEITLDPGVLCPNSTLEAIAWGNPQNRDELASTAGVKAWFARDFGEEVLQIFKANDDSS